MSLSRVSALLLAALLGLLSPGAKRAGAAVLDDVDEDDREAVEALALYPEDVRENALRAATEPGTLERLQALQTDSQDQFRDLLDPFSQDDQEQLFELSRYPDLIEEIAQGGPKGRAELERIAARYPEDVREAAVRQGSDRHRVVSRMNGLLQDFDARFDGLVDDLSPADRDAFRSLLGTPELLSLLSEHMSMTVVLGEAYGDDPAGTKAELAALNLEVARRNAQEADDWKKDVDADPDLRRDYENAARDYERDTGYSAYQGPRTVVNVSFNPYPYWFGYPWWYPVAYDYYDPWYWWYPRRSWGHCGYHYGPRISFYGGPIWRPWYPTYHFTSWYFSFGHHHARYPYFSDHFVSYYDRPLHVTNIHNYHYYNVRRRTVRKFVHHTDRVMPAKFFAGKNRKERAERFREYGKLAPQIEKVDRDVRKKDLARERGKRGREFGLRDDRRGDDLARAEVQKIVAKNPKEYPTLSKVDKKAWERDAAAADRERGKGKGAVDRERPKGAADRERAKGGPGDKGAPGPGLEAPKARERGDKARPAVGEREQGKARKGGGAPESGTLERERGQGGKGKADKARPTFERPGGDRPADRERGSAKPGGKDGEGRGGGADRPSAGSGAKQRETDGGAKRERGGSAGKREKAAEPKRATPSFDAPDAQRERNVRKAEPRREQAPSYDAPRKERSGGGGGGNVEGRSQRREEAPRVRQEEPRVRQEAPRQEPRVERSGGDRPKGGGGGGGGGGKQKNNDTDEEVGGGGGGGGGGKRAR
jgi:hypothetical protein